MALVGLAASACSPDNIDDIPPELSAAYALPPCPLEGTDAVANLDTPTDCVFLQYYGWNTSRPHGFAMRYTSTAANWSLDVANIADRTIAHLFTVHDIDPAQPALFAGLTSEGGLDVVAPVIGEANQPALSIWVSDHSDQGANFISAGEVPRGRMIPWAPECNLFMVAKTDGNSESRLGLYRLRGIQRYRDGNLGFDFLGDLTAHRLADGACNVSDDGAIERSGVPREHYVRELCARIDGKGAVEHRLVAC